MQETWIRALEGADRLRDDVPAERWVFGIARNLVRIHYRGRRGRPDGQAGGNAGDPVDPSTDRGTQRDGEEDEARREQAALLAAVVKTMPPAPRELLTLRYTDGCTVPEIAQRLGISVKAAEGRLARAREEARRRARRFDPELFR